MPTNEPLKQVNTLPEIKKPEEFKQVPDTVRSGVASGVTEIIPFKPKATQDENKNPDPKKPRTSDKPKQGAGVGDTSTSAVPVKKDEIPPEQRSDSKQRKNEKVVFIKHSELYPPKIHPFGVRDDFEMKALADSVKSIGVTQPALVRPLESGGYELVCGNRRQRANELAGFMELPCIVRNMTDDEAIIAMTDDNLRQRSEILPSEKANALKMQLDAISHQGLLSTSRHNGEKLDVAQLSVNIVAERNSISPRMVHRYIRLTELIPDLKTAIDEKRLGFVPAVEISFIRPKNQEHIALTLESLQIKPSELQAKRMRELDKDGSLNSDVIDGILLEEKKEEIRVIISGTELEKYFGKTKTPREMKDQIIKLLDDWKEKQPQELSKPGKTKEAEK